MLTVLHGHSLTKLREMASESVHVWVTSPPYWGLRDYGIPAQVWGGGDMDCEHVWGDEIRTPWANSVSGPNGANKNGPHSRHQPKTTGPFCQKCDAWFGHLGLEPNPELYVRNLVMVLREARRVLRFDGTLWLNLGDSYAGSRSGEKREIPHYDGRDYDVHLSNNRVALKAEQNIPRGGRVKDARSKQATNRSSDFEGPHRCHSQVPDSKNPKAGIPTFQPNRTPIPGLKPKDLVGIPWMVAFALRADGWWLRSRIPWIKRNCMPESTTDRPSTAIEEVFLLSKSEQYFYDSEAVAVPASANSNPRCTRWKSPDGWDTSLGEGGHGSFHKEGREKGKTGYVPKSFRKPGVNPKAIVPDGMTKQNTSFSAAVVDLVSDRNRRNSDWFFESWQGLLSDELGEPLVLVVNTQPYKEAHFATFPPRLIQPMILAGTSARGCCSQCGAPWERIVEDGSADLEHQRACGGDRNGEYHGTATKDFEFAKAQNASEVKMRILRGMTESKTVGWSPTCKCAGYRVRSTTSRRIEAKARAPKDNDLAPHDVAANTKFVKRSNASRLGALRDSARARGAEYGTLITDPSTSLGMTSSMARRRRWYRSRWQERINARFHKVIPCTVGDMFGGSGTTGEVALELGRAAILIELNEKYLPLIDRRCDVTPGLALA